jgi:hypothetical protein
MHIHDFHSKLTSGSEEGNLFQALRTLSLVEDVRFISGDATIDVDWGSWPPGGGDGSLAAAHA